MSAAKNKMYLLTQLGLVLLAMVLNLRMFLLVNLPNLITKIIAHFGDKYLPHYARNKIAPLLYHIAGVFSVALFALKFPEGICTLISGVYLISTWLIQLAIQSVENQNNQKDNDNQEVYAVFERLAKKANLHEAVLNIVTSNSIYAVAFYEKKMVKITTGLLNILTIDEISGVLGHEITHLCKTQSERNMQNRNNLVYGFLYTYLMWSLAIGEAIEILSITTNRPVKDIESMRDFLIHYNHFSLHLVVLLVSMLCNKEPRREEEIRADKGSVWLTNGTHCVNMLETMYSSNLVFSSIRDIHNSFPKLFRVIDEHPSLDERKLIMEREFQIMKKLKCPL